MKTQAVVVLVGVLCVMFAHRATGEQGSCSSWINAKEAYGLVGDGVADDTAGLQKAFKTRSVPVYIPKGMYRFTRTLHAASDVKVFGAGGGWHPKGQTALIYDGKEGGIALSARKISTFQMRRMMIVGSKKAAVGIYWMFCTNESLLEDVSVRETTAHALYITQTWYATFTRFVARNNYGSGITIDQDRFKALVKGHVNYVNFISCRSNNNGMKGQYDGDKVIDTNYGFGSFGNNTMINLIGCCFEGNGGAGVYLTGHPVNFNFSGCYFEQNARTILNATANKPATQGTSQPATAPTPIGRAASIIEDADFGQWSVVFDNIYVHKRNGVWLKGKGTNTPITFKHMVRPTVIWSEHGNWEMIDCKVDHPVTLAPGIMVTDAKLVAQGILWIDPTNSPPSGHPGYFTTRGVRKVAPAPSDGLDLYVDTDNGDDRNDGRTATKAWKSLAKAMGMYSNTVLDTPVTIHLAGEADSQFTLSNVSGTGVMTLKCTASAKLTNGLIADVGCRIVIEAAGQLQAAGLTVQSSPAVRINGVRFVLSDEPALICQDASNVVVSDCDFSGPADSTAILADSHARLYVDSTDIVQRVVARNGAAIETASQATSCD